MSLYENLAATALRLLAKYGAPTTIQRVTIGAYNPATGTASNSTSNLTTTGLVRLYQNKLIDGERVKVGDKEVVLSNEQIPLLSDKIIVDSVPWSIVNIREVNPAGTPIVYFAQIRK